METHKPLLKDADGEDVDEHLYRSMIRSLMYLTSLRLDIMFADSPFDLVAYTDSDYARASLDRKSTTRGCQFLGYRLISWQCKKQTMVANSTTEAKYVAASSCCGEVKCVNMQRIRTHQGDLLTKAFDVSRFQYLIFWATAKVKTVNGEVQLQALVDGKKVIITETSVRRVLKLKDVEGIECLPNADIFEQLALMGFVQVFLDKQVGDMSTHNRTYDAPCHTKKIFANMKREGKGFSGKVTPLFQTMMVQAQEEVVDENLPTHSNDPLLSGEDRLKLNELIELCTNLSQRVLDLEKTKTSQAAKITELKKRVKKLEKKGGLRTHKLKRLYKIGRSARVVSSEDEDMAEKEVDVVEKEISTAEPVTTAGEVVTTASVEVATISATTTTFDELTLVQTLIEIKAAKPKAVTTAATTTIVTRPNARGVIVQEPSEFTTTSPSQPSQLPQAKDKGNAKMVEPEKPLMKKDRIMFDKEVAQKLQAQLDVELEEEEKLAKKREEDANIAEWDRVQELMDKRKKHFARLRAEEQRRKPPTKAQKRNQMCTYLKNMAEFTQSQLKNKSFDEVQKAFDKTMGWIDSFESMDSEVVKGGKDKAECSKTIAQECSERAGDELEQERIKKQKIDDDQEEAEMKKHMEIVVDEEEIAVDVITLATKPPINLGWKIIKEGKMGYFQIIRADGSSKRPEKAYERVLWGDLKVMFEPDIESEVWRNLQGHKLTV
ncbi:uncharacterized mitochondrial protein-like protein [Tanacetum coccineum]